MREVLFAVWVWFVAFVVPGLVRGVRMLVALLIVARLHKWFGVPFDESAAIVSAVLFAALMPHE